MLPFRWQTYLFVVSYTDLQLYVYSRASKTLVNTMDLDANPYDVTTPVTLRTITHNCNTMGCQQLCVNIGSGEGVCQCAEGYYINVDGVTCDSECLAQRSHFEVLNVT